MSKVTLSKSVAFYQHYEKLKEEILVLNCLTNLIYKFEPLKIQGTILHNNKEEVLYFKCHYQLLSRKYFTYEKIKFAHENKR